MFEAEAMVQMVNVIFGLASAYVGLRLEDEPCWFDYHILVLQQYDFGCLLSSSITIPDDPEIVICSPYATYIDETCLSRSLHAALEGHSLSTVGVPEKVPVPETVMLVLKECAFPWWIAHRMRHWRHKREFDLLCQAATMGINNNHFDYFFSYTMNM